MYDVLIHDMYDMYGVFPSKQTMASRVTLLVQANQDQQNNGVKT